MPQQPQPPQRDLTQLRNQLAVNAPIEYAMVTEALGTHPNLRSDEARAGVFAVWAKMSREWADAMARELGNTTCKG